MYGFCILVYMYVALVSYYKMVLLKDPFSDINTSDMQMLRINSWL